MGAESATLARAPAKQAKQPAKQSAQASAAPQRVTPQREFAARGGAAVPKSFPGIPPLAPNERNSCQRNPEHTNSTIPLAHSGSSYPGLRLPLQRKLVIGEVNDPLEYEADRIAEQVTADSPQPASVPRLTAATVSVPLQRACSGGGIGAGCKREEDEEKLQQKAAPGSAALQAVTGVPPIVNEVLHTSGKPMSHVIRTFFEPRFRHDFSHVRIHTDARAAESAKQMRAHAYTVGPHIVFARDRFAPSGAPGQKLLAHELTHVLQQEKEPSIARLQREDVPNDPYPGTEDGEQPGLFSLSDEGFAFLKGHEGCRLALYNDSAGHCTIGFGHLVHHGKCNGNEPENFKSGISEDDASDLFSADLEKYEAAVSSNVTSRLNQAFYDALVSFTFNIGIGGFRGSGVLRQINQKNYSKVPEEMMKWNTPTEIEGRRTDEANLFRTGNYSYPPVKCT